MRFLVIDDGTGLPLYKAGEPGPDGHPVKWAEIGEVVDIPVDSAMASERQRAQAWTAGQSRKLRPAPPVPRVDAPPASRAVPSEATVKKSAPAPKKSGKG